MYTSHCRPQFSLVSAPNLVVYSIYISSIKLLTSYGDAKVTDLKTCRKRDAPKSAQQSWFKTVFDMGDLDCDTDVDKKCNANNVA